MRQGRRYGCGNGGKRSESNLRALFTTTGIGSRTALGLAIVFGIVKNHDGFTDVKSEPEQGTGFRLDMPVAQVGKRSVSDAAPAIESPRLNRIKGRGTVRLAEDEQTMLRLLNEVLCRNGYCIFAARDAEEAIDLYRRHCRAIDVVVLDIGLPKVSGWKVIRNIKAENPGVKIVVASGYMDPEFRSEIHRAGVKDFIYKPYKPDPIIDRLRALIDRP